MVLEERSGFWVGLGAGSGWDIPTSIVPDESPRGVAAFLRAGGALTPQVLFGGEVIGRSVKTAVGSEYRGNASFVMLVYPGSSGSLFVKGGVGPSFVGESFGGGYRGTYTVGLGLTAGAGFHRRLADGIQVTSGLDLLYQSFHAGPNLRSTHRLLLVTIGLFWH